MFLVKVKLSQLHGLTSMTTTSNRVELFVTLDEHMNLRFLQLSMLLVFFPNSGGAPLYYIDKDGCLNNLEGVSIIFALVLHAV